jgi:amidase
MKTYVDWLAPTFLLSMSGLPIASVPCGLDSAKMPVGLQIVGRPRGEEAVLALAGRVQAMNSIGLPVVSSRA